MLHEDLTEAQTRKKIIDGLLEKAGWDLKDHSQVREEFEIAGTGAGNTEFNPSGFSDYMLLDRSGEPLI